MIITPIRTKDAIIGWRRGRATFMVGDTVKLPCLKTRARISMVYQDVRGGVRLDKTLAGFYSWNVADLTKVRGRR